MVESKKPRARNAPANVREFLNSAAKVSAEIIDTLSLVTSKGQILSPEQLANFKLATETLKTCRELYLRQQALKKQTAQVQQLFNVTPTTAVTDELRLIAASLVNQSNTPAKPRVKDDRDDDKD
jgi:hypothetical protein